LYIRLCQWSPGRGLSGRLSPGRQTNRATANWAGTLEGSVQAVSSAPDNAVQPVNRRTVRPGLRSENSQNYYHHVFIRTRQQ